MNRNFDSIIVGAGASGLMAAIQAARKGAQILILEHMELMCQLMQLRQVK